MKAGWAWGTARGMREMFLEILEVRLMAYIRHERRFLQDKSTIAAAAPDSRLAVVWVIDQCSSALHDWCPDL